MRQAWVFTGCSLLAGAAMAQSVASIPVNATLVREPIWKNYGGTIRDANGNVTQLPMEVPFFRTVSIHTTVYVSLENVNTVVEKMQSRRVNGNSDLMVASAAGDVEWVRTLLGKNMLVNTKNMFGSTAVMGAAAGGHDEIVKLLLARGAQVNIKNSQGYTALMLAAKNGQASTVELLLNNKSDPDLADAVNRTALMYAVNGGHEEVVKQLMAKGARADYTDRSGVSPVALASSRKGRENILILLTRLPEK